MTYKHLQFVIASLAVALFYIFLFQKYAPGAANKEALLKITSANALGMFALSIFIFSRMHKILKIVFALLAPGTILKFIYAIMSYGIFTYDILDFFFLPFVLGSWILLLAFCALRIVLQNSMPRPMA